MTSMRLGALVAMGMLAACGPDDPDDQPARGGSSGASGAAGTNNSSGASNAGAAGSIAGSSSGGTLSGGANAGGSGGSAAGSTGAGGALTGQAWKDFMFQSYCPATCEQTMKLPCYSGGATAMACLNECYAYWTNVYAICPSAAPPLTQCGFPDKVSYACAGGMVSESFDAACSAEVDALSACN